MAETTTAGRKSPLRSPVTWVIILGVALAGGAFLLYRQRQSQTAANANTNAAAAPTTEDFSGQIATLQAEVSDLQSSFAQGEKGETGGTSSGGGTTTKLKAPAGLSVTPKAASKGGTDFGWSAVTGAKAYELEVTGAGGKGTGTSHYDHAGAGTHAEGVKLAKGRYRARVRAGTSTAALSGEWTPFKEFTVPAR